MTSAAARQASKGEQRRDEHRRQDPAAQHRRHHSPIGSAEQEAEWSDGAIRGRCVTNALTLGIGRRERSRRYAARFF